MTTLVQSNSPPASILAGLAVNRAYVAGDALNQSVTVRVSRTTPACAKASPADIKLKVMEKADRQPVPSLPYRVGHGFDLHRLEEGPYKLILGGLEIPHNRGCVAHSDGRILLLSTL